MKQAPSWANDHGLLREFCKRMPSSECPSFSGNPGWAAILSCSLYSNDSQSSAVSQSHLEGYSDTGGWAPRICISHKFPGDAMLLVQEPHFEALAKLQRLKQGFSSSEGGSE